MSSLNYIGATGELKNRVKNLAFPPDKRYIYPMMIHPEQIYRIIDEMRVEFLSNVSFFKDVKTVDELIVYWEREIDRLKTSSEDNRVLISWMRARVRDLKWFMKWFGTEETE